MFTLFSHLISSSPRWMVCSPLLTPGRSAHFLGGIRGTGGQNWDRIHRTGSVTQISSLGKTLSNTSHHVSRWEAEENRIRENLFTCSSVWLSKPSTPSRIHTISWVVVGVCSLDSSPGYCFASSCLSLNATQSKWLFPFYSLLLAPLPFFHDTFCDLYSCVCGLVSSLNIRLLRQIVSPLRSETISDFSFGVLSFCTVWHIISHQ